MNEYAGKKITKTSFLDDSFRKNLESALRFGNPLLVQDVENYDPILNPVLNRELRRTGGRVLITLGDQVINTLFRQVIIHLELMFLEFSLGYRFVAIVLNFPLDSRSNRRV